MLSTLLTSGVPVHRALELVVEGCSTGPVRDTLASVSASVSQGQRLSMALAQAPQAFPPLLESLVRAGEDSGQLDALLARYVVFHESSARTARQLRAALTYPAIVLVLTVVVVAIMAVVVFPRQRELYQSLGVTEVSVLTRLLEGLLGLAAWLPWLAVASPLLVLANSTLDASTRQKLREAFDGALLRLPLLGSVIHKAATVRLLIGLAIFFEAGITLGPAFRPLGKMLGNAILENRFAQFLESIAKGGCSLSLAASQSEAFLPVVVALFRVGEEQGSLSHLCRQTADIVELEVESSFRTLETLLEPLAMAVMGLVVGFVVLASSLPMLGVLQQL
ncbi:MAG: type II secretion system F family protein [Vulcanimicrobiota bacterium]